MGSTLGQDKKAVLLINLGSPESLSLESVREYLKEFLSDPFVIDIHPVLRWLLVQMIILPFRSPKTLSAYAKIWSKDRGSPLVFYTEDLRKKLAYYLKEDVFVAMRYGSSHNNISAMTKSLLKQYDHLTVVPLYPQYADSSTGTALQSFYLGLEGRYPKSLKIIRDFYDQDFYIRALAHSIQKINLPQDFYLLFSYHGLPERHLSKIEGEKMTCGEDPCQILNQTPSNKSSCYRAQCYTTTHLVMKDLDYKLPHGVSFQSRLGRTPWIKPYTDEFLNVLVKKGIKKLAVISPSFVADCLETLEEIGIRTKEQWMSLGGEAFVFIPCLNDQDDFAQGLGDFLQNK